MENNVWQWICRLLLSISLSLLISCEASTFPPEKYFYGSQLLLAQAIAKTDLQRVKELAIKTNLNTPGKQDMTLLFYTAMIAEKIPKSYLLSVYWLKMVPIRYRMYQKWVI